MLSLKRSEDAEQSAPRSISKVEMLMQRYCPVAAEVMPELSVVVPDLPIWKYTLLVRLVDEAILKVLSVE